MKENFDSEFCHVDYVNSDNVVLLSWKKFARLDDYREPILFALNLLQQYPQSNLVVDARNGFEDDPADVAWGFAELLPQMGQTDCQYVAFIMAEVPAIEAEMDMWTKEFGKYFAVVKAADYEQAIRKMKEQLLVNVKYTIASGKREAFLKAAEGIMRASREEPGNLRYDYYQPVESDNDLLLLEIWVDEAAQVAHGKTAHYQKLQALKKDYVTAVAIEKFNIAKA